MSLAASLWLFAAATGAAGLGAALGMAGGIFIVPILATFAGADLHTAIAVSLVSVVASSCASSVPFLRAGLTNVRLAVVLELATTAGAVVGVLLAGVMPVRYLYVLFAVILAVSAAQMLGRRRERTAAGGGADWWGWAGALALHSSAPHHRVGHPPQPYRVQRLPLGLSMMFGAGLVSALLGIGSGVLKIPAMDTALRLPIKVSSGTASFMIGVTAAGAAGAFLIRGEVTAALAGPVVLGSVLGSVAGARVLVRVPVAPLRVAFVVALLVLAAQMLLEGLGVHTVGRA